MDIPPHPSAFEVLCLLLADEGREAALLGEGLDRVRNTVRPFMVGEAFPDVYFEHPLVGDPFLDVTVLYGEIEPGLRIESDAAAGTDAMLDWYAAARAEIENISCGYELDTKNPDLPAAAVHFQPREHIELVEPFCAVVGEPERAKLYLDQAKRMPPGWQLAFFGMFRGRPGSPLRVCGYLAPDEKQRVANDATYLATVFDEIGFTAYTDDMLAQVSELMAVAPGILDFQLDVYPDGTLGDVLGIDAQFGIERPEAVCKSFDDGPGSRVMRLFERWGTADGRWRLAAHAAFARALPVELEDGTPGRFAFTLMPQWVKARWSNGTLQPSKLYHLGKAQLV